MKEITYEQYRAYLNEWVDGKYVVRVPKGKRLVATSNGKYYIDDRVDKFIVKDKKKK